MSEPSCMIQFLGQTLELLPEHAIFWHDEEMLIIADAHLGKVGHFRKAGIPVPAQAGERTAQKLENLTRQYAPRTVLFLGDLFHSRHNKEWSLFLEWRERHASTDIILVQGNHDILPVSYYKEAGMELALDSYVRPPFLFVHEPLEAPHHRFYALAGHVHPAVRLRGGGRQALNMPCFLLGEWQGLLPAFGAFTGTALVKPLKGDRVYVVSDGCILNVV